MWVFVSVVDMFVLNLCSCQIGSVDFDIFWVILVMVDFIIFVFFGVYVISVVVMLDILQVVLIFVLCVKVLCLMWCVLLVDVFSVCFSNGMQVEIVMLLKCLCFDGSIWIVLGVGLDYVGVIVMCLVQDDVQ